MAPFLFAVIDGSIDVPSSKFVLYSISMNKVVLQTVHIIQLVRRMNECGNG